MGAEHTTRVRRVAEGLRGELAALLQTEIKDPGVAGAIISKVEMTGDLRSARIYVRLLQGGDQPEERQRLIEALGRARGVLRREATRRLMLRHAPELRFTYDTGLDHTLRIEELLAEVEAERRK